MKYKVDQEVVILREKIYEWELESNKIFKIQETFIDDSIPEYGEVERYKIYGLWFNIDDIKPVTLKEHPEYYL